VAAPMNRRQFLRAGVYTTLATSVLRAQEARPMLTIAHQGRSDYSIVQPEAASPSQAHAALELQAFISEMAGVALPVVSDTVPLPKCAILLGRTRHTSDLLGEATPDGRLGDDGFAIRTVGPHVVIAGGPVRGTLYGVYELLERYWGCRWYSTLHSVIPRHGTLTLPEIDDLQVPAFAMREPFWYEMLDGDLAARNRANGSNMRLEERHGGKIRFGGGLFVHTFYRLVPPDEFFADHPEYFSLIDGERRIGFSQLCLTNPDVLRIVTERVLERIRRDPDARLFSVSQNDWDGHCTCDACMEIERAEESPAGTLIWFVNQVAEAVEREFPDVWIETLAYQYTRKPPKSIRPRHNVVPRICTIECDFSAPLDVSTYAQNQSLVEDMRGWSALSDKLYVWDYTTNFHNYIGPHPNFPALQGNARFFRDNRVVGLFEQGAAEGPHAEFGELRGWLLAKLLWNPDQPIEPLLDDFFSGYYGAAAGPVRQYFDELQKLPGAAGATLRIFDSLRNPWLSLEFVERAEALFAEAERLASGDDALLYRVRMTGIPVLWARTRLMAQPRRRYQVDGDRLVLSELDPAYRRAGAELLSRVHEGKVRIREYNGYHTQALIDLTGEIEGFPLTTVAAGGIRLSTAPGCGGSAIAWTDGDGRNRLCPELGGVEVIDRHDDPQIPGFSEYDVLETGDAYIGLREKEPIAVWGPQTKERLGEARELRLADGSLRVTHTFSMEQQTRTVSPAARIALHIGGPGPVRIERPEGGDTELALADGEGARTFELPESACQATSFRLEPLAGGGEAAVSLSEAPSAGVCVHLDRAAGAAVLVARLPERQVAPGEPEVVEVTVRVAADG